MKKIAVIFLVLTVALLFSGCSKDTYTQESTSRNFKLKNVVSVELSGPGSEIDGDSLSVSLTSSTGQDFVDMVELVTGKKLDSLPEAHSFGLAVMTYTTKYSETVKAYPANDGSNYICLYSLNTDVCKYLELSEESMATIVQIFDTNGISVIIG